MKDLFKKFFVMCATGAGAIVGFVASGLLTGTIITSKDDHKNTKDEDKAE